MALLWKSSRRALAVLVIVTLPVLLVLPFHPEAGLYADLMQASPPWLQAHLWRLFEWGGNMAAFAIYAIALSAFLRLPLVALVGCATSVCLELAQLAIPDRVASLGDVALNSTGTLIGVAVVGVIRLLARAAMRRDGVSGAAPRRPRPAAPAAPTAPTPRSPQGPSAARSA